MRPDLKSGELRILILSACGKVFLRGSDGEYYAPSIEDFNLETANEWKIRKAQEIDFYGMNTQGMIPLQIDKDIVFESIREAEIYIIDKYFCSQRKFWAEHSVEDKDLMIRAQEERDQLEQKMLAAAHARR